MDSVMKGLMGAMPPRIFGLEPPLHTVAGFSVVVNRWFVCMRVWQLMSTELDAILREQNRQDDLCLQHYITELL